ncbi:hypothetical protein N7537_008806 [Penicillium hordei]|uniref:Zn(2)-C6 fungal-type domain-containing protein n=1 Tax=Penicillium hordei TaxID=40994 RepID=A0AAD6E1B7_9EURO|nr:uncharacterized protein N7537_008806 [Penicillium hordei]KAJ5598722.1 hypothetical protein N7537_008806 [Penicillium hordei]
MELASSSGGRLGSKSQIKKKVENCQTRKKRCEGNLPSCSTCLKQGLPCKYMQVKRRGKGKV